MNTPSTDHTVSPPPPLRNPAAESSVGSRMELRMVGMVIGLATGVDYMSNLMFSIAGPHIEGGVLASQDVYLWAVTAYAAAASLSSLMPASAPSSGCGTCSSWPMLVNGCAGRGGSTP